jgi:hypothetical protein
MNTLRPQEETSTMEEIGTQTFMKTNQTPNCLHPAAAAADDDDDDDDENDDGYG